MRQNPEQKLQRAVAHYLTFALDRSVWWSAIGHGGGGAIRGAQLRMMGLKPGISDLLICWAEQDGERLILWLELKSERGRLSSDQLAFAKTVGALGHFYHVCRSLDEVAAVLKNHCVPMRGRLAA